MRLVKSADLLTSHLSESTYPHDYFLSRNVVFTRLQACNGLLNLFKLPLFCSQPVAALAVCQQRPERWRMEVLDFCTESHKSSSVTRRKSRTSNNPVPVLRMPSKYSWMSCSLNESNLNQLRHKLQAWKQGCARLMNQRQQDSSYQPLAMDSSPQLPSGTNYTTSTIVPRSNRTHYRHNIPPRTSGIHGPGRVPAERRAPLFGDARYP